MVQKIVLFDPPWPEFPVAPLARIPGCTGCCAQPLFGRKRRFVALRFVAPRGPLDSSRVRGPDLMSDMRWERAWVHRAARWQAWGAARRRPLPKNGGPKPTPPNTKRAVVF